MKNIYDILEKIGVTIPEDKKKEFDKALNENYKTVAELDNVKNQKEALQAQYDKDIKQRDADLSKLQTQLKESGIESEKLQGTLKELEELKGNYTKAKESYEAEIAKQKYEYMVRDKANGLNFTSNSAKKAFIQEAIAKNLSVDGDNLLGFEDFVESYKKEDASAFKATGSKARFTTRHEDFNDDGDDGDGESDGDAPMIW